MSSKNSEKIDNGHIDPVKIGSRTLLIRKTLDISQTELAEQAELSPSLISLIERGKRKPSFELIQAFAVKHKVNIGWYLTGEGEPFLPEQKQYSMVVSDVEQHYAAEKAKNGTEFIPIPQVTPATAGEVGEITDGEIIGYKYFEKGFLNQFKNPLLTTVNGDSMLPVLHDGDLVLIDRAVNARLSPRPDFLYLVNCNDQVDEVAITVKRVSLNDTKLVCFPLNTTYNPLEVDLQDRNILSILLGRVVWYARTLV